jgi:lysozyme family protein
MAPTFDAAKLGYHNLWNKAQVTSTDAAAKVAHGIIADRERYEAAATAIGHSSVWPLIGAIHNRESSRSFSTHLHNGDPLTGYTTHVPAGRPQVGHGPPFTWEESAQDALKLQGWDKIADWPLERWLYEAERYNGWGYLGKINSPYVWAGTTLQQRGKYVSDGKFDSSAWDSQLGIAAILKAVFDYLPDAMPDSAVAPPVPTVIEPVPNEQVMRDVINAVLPVIESQYVVLTKEQFQKLLELVKG